MQDPLVRGRYGVLSGATGIFLNVCLFAAKFLAGILTSSIAITADAFNNLSDAGSSVVTLVGFKMAQSPADKEHPFGHGRIEYLSGLAVSIAIFLVGLELVKSSFDKILHPQTVDFSLVSFMILVASVLVKLWMCYFNRTIARKIDSTAMKATAMDSLTDATATSAVAVGILLSHFFEWKIDGWIGILVAGFILYTGFQTAKDSLSPLLGQPPAPEFVQAIADTVMAHPEIVGIHDLIVHDYGPGRCMISLHAEVPSNADILAVHDIIDTIELQLREKFHCDATIHMDPIAVDDALTRDLREQVEQIVKAIDPALSIHDFRLVAGKTHTNLIFDLVVPFRFRLDDRTLMDLVKRKIREMEGNYFAVLTIDKSFV